MALVSRVNKALLMRGVLQRFVQIEHRFVDPKNVQILPLVLCSYVLRRQWKLFGKSRGSMLSLPSSARAKGTKERRKSRASQI